MWGLKRLPFGNEVTEVTEITRDIRGENRSWFVMMMNSTNPTNLTMCRWASQALANAVCDHFDETMTYWLPPSVSWCAYA
jgi:hypothetical protein